MFNNEITYAEKWDTQENRKALKQLQDKFFDKSECCPDCPLSWAPEVLALLNKLERELGIAYNEGTVRGYFVQGSFLNWFLTSPVKSFLNSCKHNYLETPTDYSAPRNADGLRPKLALHKRAVAPLVALKNSIAYGINAVKIIYLNPLRNKLLKPKMRLSQVKEKYGTLRIYFSTSEAYEEYVESEIRKCEVLLAKKGAYFPLENMWEWAIGYSVDTDYNPDTIATKIRNDGTVDVSQTKYRKVMKEVGLDIKSIKEKAELKKAIKDNIDG